MLIQGKKLEVLGGVEGVTYVAMGCCDNKDINHPVLSELIAPSTTNSKLLSILILCL